MCSHFVLSDFMAVTMSKIMWTLMFKNPHWTAKNQLLFHILKGEMDVILLKS